MSPPTMDLDAYRALVSLDVPFRPPAPAPAEEHPALMRSLCAWLREDGTARRLHAELGEHPSLETDERAWLRALLTVRGPEPLPEDFHGAMDRLLQAERRRRPDVHPAGLPRLGLPGTPAAWCTVWQGDITTLAVDAIVNAANSELLGCFRPFHPCIDNAIHVAAGPRLREDCARLMRAQGHPEHTGHAKATRAYNLPSRYVLHTVGPIVRGPLSARHEEALAACYRANLDLATRLHGVRSVALCAISTGVFGFPKVPAAQVALRTVGAWLREQPGALDQVVFNVFGDEDRAAYDTALQEGALDALA
ncbi:protein-ADP-ribose hydrolase [Corallococcus sp. AB004]|uniref:protein-ADP-ribose hydrolase n=1 Tax=Corallococcus sp. AB038B TaxID=2316718 RepID=UPI000EA046AD|nr:protein-ADP-ribose hydrolase [Corallococcus sp. AB038B]RKH97578.1 protein-ADP-ribose hydrolase [Corallococcus sp. AB038B]RKI44665.1 protein-ADP-ribose hydrolase [Corallococcus sp. AB004]